MTGAPLVPEPFRWTGQAAIDLPWSNPKPQGAVCDPRRSAHYPRPMMPYREALGGIIEIPAFGLVEACEDGLVLDDLEAARRAYDAAVQAVDDAAQALQEARDDIPAARQRLHDAIVKAAKKGARQIDIAEVSGYRRERIRQILRAAGVEAK